MTTKTVCQIVRCVMELTTVETTVMRTEAVVYYTYREFVVSTTYKT